MMYRFGPFLLDPDNYNLSRAGQRLRLSASLVRLLVLFVRNPGGLLTRDEIARCLWTDSRYVDATSGINTAVNRIRYTLGDSSSSPNYIETVIGLGYRFIAAVEELPDGAPAQSEAEAGKPPSALSSLDSKEPLERPEPAPHPFPPPAPQTSRPRTQPWWMAAAGAALAVGIALIAAQLWLWHKHAGSLPPRVPEKIDFVQSTFSDSSDHLDVAAIAHKQHLVVFATQAGISVRSMDRGVDQLLWADPELHATHLSWTPADDAVILSGKSAGHETGAIWFIPLATGVPRLLLQDGQDASLSPDGKLLAFTRASGGELWVSSADTSNPHRLISAESGSFSGLTWSALSGRIGYTRHLPSAPSSDPSGRDIPWEFDSADAQTGEVLGRESNLHILSAAETRSGELFYLSASAADGAPHLYSVATDLHTGRFLSNPVPLSLDRKLDGMTDLSASDDGRLLSAVAYPNTSSINTGTLQFPGPTLTDVRRLVHPAPDNFPHAWTLDGRSVIFESDDIGKYVIYQQALDGSAARLLVRSLGGAISPTLSPDGHWILYMNLLNYKPESIFRVPAEGGAIQRVEVREPFEGFRCSLAPSGICAVRRREGDELVFTEFDALAGEGAEVARVRTEANELMGDWGLSPDGKTIALAIHDNVHPAILRIYLRSGHKSRTDLLPFHGIGELRSVSWSADGRGYFTQSQKQHTFYLDYVEQDGRTAQLRETTGPSWAVPSRDNRKVAFLNYDLIPNVWTAERNPTAP